MRGQTKARIDRPARLLSGLALALLWVCEPAQAQVCEPTEVANSDHGGADSISGSLPVLVTCDEGFEGGGVTFCQGDGTFLPLACTAHDECEMPPGVVATDRYLEGSVPLYIGGALGTVTLHVQNVVKNTDGSWTTDPLDTFSGGICPEDMYRIAALEWQTFYYDMALRGVPATQLVKLLAAISGNPGSGVFIEEYLTVAGYAIDPGKITVWPGTGVGMRRIYAHENMHGWEAQSIQDGAIMDWFQLFIDYTNRVYHHRIADPGALEGTGWSLEYSNYGLQNSAEWGSEVFQEWLYGCCGGFGGNWSYIEESQSDYADFFDCLWGTASDLATCQALHLPTVSIALPATLPAVTPPSEPGFTALESQGAWKACMGRALHANERDAFNDLNWSVAPLLPADPSLRYTPLLADCDHDGTLDWVCQYNGPGPSSVGNGGYLWNTAYEDGAYSFITTGEPTGTYTEFQQDPYVADPISGYVSIIQPDYRHWQGEYGSCYGATPLGVIRDWGIDPFERALAEAATCSLSENLEDPSCYSPDLLLWLDAQDASSLLSLTGSAADEEELTGWSDKSIRGNDAIAYVSTKRPVLYTDLFDGLPAVAFTDDILELRGVDLTPGTTPELTSIAVSRRTGGYGSVWSPSQNGFDKREHNTGGAASDAWAITTTILQQGTSGDRVDTWTDGVPTIVDGLETYEPMYAGLALGPLLYPGPGSPGYYAADHDVAELLLIKRALSEAERAEIEASLAVKWGMRLASYPCGSPCEPLYSEDFDGLALGPFVSWTESGGDGTDFTRTPPTGWSRDESTTPVGAPEEFRGFTFLDLGAWVATAGNQDRTDFTAASGTIMVADGDEYDDGTSVEPDDFNVFMTTSPIDLTGVLANSVVLELDSSFRQYDQQTGVIEVSFDSGTTWDELLVLNTANSGADRSRTNEHLQLLIDNPAGGTMTLRFAYLNAGNDWWWAIDNLEVTGGL